MLDKNFTLKELLDLKCKFCNNKLAPKSYNNHKIYLEYNLDDIQDKLSIYDNNLNLKFSVNINTNEFHRYCQSYRMFYLDFNCDNCFGDKYYYELGFYINDESSKFYLSESFISAISNDIKYILQYDKRFSDFSVSYINLIDHSNDEISSSDVNLDFNNKEEFINMMQLALLFV